jgi:hypothetical protein
VKFLEIVEPFEHRGRRVRTELVAVDGVVREARGHLVVARIGERLAVGHVRVAPGGAIAEDLTLLGDGAPEERKQRRAPRGGRVAPVALAQVLLRHPAAARLVVEQIRLGAGEDLLPAQTVAHDEHDVLRLARERGGAP